MVFTVNHQTATIKLAGVLQRQTRQEVVMYNDVTAAAAAVPAARQTRRM